MGQRTDNHDRRATPGWHAGDHQALLTELDRRFRPRRNELLATRTELAGTAPGPLDHTEAVRAERWQVAPVPSHFTATAHHPLRSWAADEPSMCVDGRPMAASLYDLVAALVSEPHGGDPFVRLEDVRGHLEARLWNDVFCHVQDELGIARGTIRATVVIDNGPAAFEMDEMLYELREHGAALELGAAPVDLDDCRERLVATSRRRGVLSLRRGRGEIPQPIPA